MAMRSPRLLALALVLGCADDGAPPWYVGDWRSDDDSGFECTHFLNLREEDSYAEFKKVCVLESERVGIEIYMGTYKLDSGRMLFSWIRSSCADSERSETVGLSPRNNDDELGLSTPGGLLIFARFEPSGAGAGGGRAGFGCYNGGSTFTPSPLADL